MKDFEEDLTPYTVDDLKMQQKNTMYVVLTKHFFQIIQ